MKPYQEISGCRICGNKNLRPILSLGKQSLTGVFPKTKDQHVASGPLSLVQCDEAGGGGGCGLVQLRESYDKGQMYGNDYGYRSGLNPSMADHLQAKGRRILSQVPLEPGDLVVDIGSNDGTLLRAYPERGQTLVGFDPAGEPFRKYYPPHAELISGYFSAAAFRERYGDKRAKIITSIAMFYDLESPLDFMCQVRDILADDGVWVSEQSYLPSMIQANSYDTICHEHLEYYCLKQIRWMTESAGLTILDVELNDVNGGSFSVTVAKPGAPVPGDPARVARILQEEEAFRRPEPYEAFRNKIAAHRDELRRFLQDLRAGGKKALGYGASTKGNVILQFCGLTETDLPCIGEVNPDKFGRYTPGTLIPIVSEAEAKAARPDYLMVLPWHFKDFILKKETDYLKSGGRLVFPLPSLSVY